jgi:two-component system, sensor histidine kinase
MSTKSIQKKFARLLSSVSRSTSRLRNTSLRTKLVLSNVLVTLLTLTTAFILITATEARRTRDEMKREIKTVSQIFVNNAADIFSTARLSEIQKTLALFESLSLVHEAILYDERGLEFARYTRKDSPAVLHQPHPLEYFTDTFADNYLNTVVPIQIGSEKIGSLYLRTSTASLDARLLASYLRLFFILLATGGISTFAAIKLQGVVSNPILSLVKVMNEIVKSQDYSIRVTREQDDEIGMLYYGFNTMLDHIQDRERHLEQVNFDLQEERYRAEAASQSKSDFLAKMSHEIRTPLNGILSLADLMLMDEENLSDEQKDDLNTVRMSAHSLKTIINDVLDFSKIEAGQLTLERTQFSLQRLIDDTIKILSVESRNANQNLVWEVTNRVPSQVLGDPTRIQQILTNLLGNAIKFTPEGGGIILFADAHNFNQNMVTVHIGVADTGIGIPKDKYELIFDSFTQADDSTTRKYGGTGLGLTICKRLTSMMGGQIWLDSVVGTGTTFHVMLELQIASNDFKTEGLARSSIPGNTPSTSNNTQKSRLRVLIAEDNPVNRETIVRFLQLKGVVPCVVSNGIEALNKTQEQHFDIILLDLQMPEMGGLEATRLIRASSSTCRNVPIIAVTADAVKGNEEICLAAGMNAFVTKPIDYQRLFQIIGEKTHYSLI